MSNHPASGQRLGPGTCSNIDHENKIADAVHRELLLPGGWKCLRKHLPPRTCFAIPASKNSNPMVSPPVGRSPVARAR